MIVISDTSVVNALLKIGQIDLLPQLFKRVLIPVRVYEELRADQICRKWLETTFPHWLEVRIASHQEQVNRLLSDLDQGEAEAIALALELSADQILLDEKAGRQVAESLGLFVTGTLGVLVAGKRSGLLPAVKPLIDQLTSQTTFRASDALKRQVLLLARE